MVKNMGYLCSTIVFLLWVIVALRVIYNTGNLSYVSFPGFKESELTVSEVNTIIK